MSLFTPDSGLLFWMLIAFGVVFFALAKYGFPVITRMVDERKQYIDQSLQAAREANEKLSHIKEESQALLKEARHEQMRILNEAMATRDQIVKEAHEKARTEGNRLLEEARMQIEKEKEYALRDIRKQTAGLAIEVAEKILRKELDSQAKQDELIERLTNEVHNAHQ